MRLLGFDNIGILGVVRCERCHLWVRNNHCEVF